ncbi:hypothetical protein TB1_008415 [Malus domestica]
MNERSTGVIREPGIGHRNSVGDYGFEVSDGIAGDNLLKSFHFHCGLGLGLAPVIVSATVKRSGFGFLLI